MCVGGVPGGLLGVGCGSRTKDPRTAAHLTSLCTLTVQLKYLDKLVEILLILLKKCSSFAVVTRD